MKRDDTHTRITFLCSGCLRAQEIVVPTTNNIAHDYAKAEEHILAEGWTFTMKGYDTLYRCKRCSAKGEPKIQRGFTQSILFD